MRDNKEKELEKSELVEQFYIDKLKEFGFSNIEISEDGTLSMAKPKFLLTPKRELDKIDISIQMGYDNLKPSMLAFYNPNIKK